MSTAKIKSFIGEFGINLPMHTYINHLRGQSSGTRLTNCSMTLEEYTNLSGVEGGIEKSGQRITIWHQEACQMMTNSDNAGRIFLYHPQTNNGLFFFFTTKRLIFIGKKT